MKMKKLLAITLSAMLILSGMVFSVSAADAVVLPKAIAKYSQSSPIIDYDTAKTANQMGSLVYGSSCTAQYNVETGAIDLSASTGNNYAIAYYDSKVSVTAGTDYCFAILYKTTSGTKLGSSGFNQGYYITGLASNNTYTAVRPNFIGNTITINGEEYCLATATLTGSTAINIYGIRFPVVTTGTAYSIYSSGVFGTSEEATSYYTSYLTALNDKVSPLAFVDFDSDSPIVTTGTASLPGSFFPVNLNGTYIAEYDDVNDVMKPSGQQFYICYFDEAVTLNATTNPTVYAAVLYTGSNDNTGNGYLMSGIGSTGAVYNSGYTRPSFTSTAFQRGSETVKIAYAEIDVSAHGYNGKKIYGIRTPQVGGTHTVYAAGIFASLDDAVQVFSDTAAPVLNINNGDCNVSGSGMTWQLNWNEATDNITPADQITYKIYTSTEAFDGTVIGAPAVTVKGETSTYLAGLAPGSNNYISIVAEDTAGNTDVKLNVCEVITEKAYAYSYTSFDSNTNMTNSNENICGGTVLTAGSASSNYDEDKDAIKVTITSSGNDYFSVYLDVPYAINRDKDKELYFAIAYQSDRDITGSPYLYSGYSNSVINNGTPYRPEVKSMSVSAGNENYKIAYAVIDVENYTYFSGISGIRTQGGLGVTAGSDFYLYGAGLFPSLADAQAALLDTTVPEFAPTVTAESDAASITVEFDPATDAVLNSNSVMYTVYASTEPITEANLADINNHSLVIGRTSIKLSSLEDNTAYYYAIVAEDAAGNKTVWSSENTVSTFKLGDINCDSYINGTDLVLLKSHLLGSSVNNDLVMDFNGDGVVNIIDLIIHKKIIAGIK